MPASERRFWPREAKHEHVLGEVKRIWIGQIQARALMLYEQSVTRDALPDELPAVRGQLIGEMEEIYCTICRKPVADWHVGEDALDALLSRVLAT